MKSNETPPPDPTQLLSEAIDALKHVAEQYGGQLPHDDCACADCEFLRPVHAVLSKLNESSGGTAATDARNN